MCRFLIFSSLRKERKMYVWHSSILRCCDYFFIMNTFKNKYDRIRVIGLAHPQTKTIEGILCHLRIDSILAP